jgi:carboxypeptidase Taq
MVHASAYGRLEDIFARITLIEQSVGMLQWDTAAVMPPGGAVARGEQLAALKSVAHGMLTDADVGPMLDAAAGEALDPWQRANLVEMRRDWLHAAAVPARLVEDLSRASTACESLWRRARAEDDFSRVSAALAEVLALTREIAQIKSQALGVAPYDALLDQYEPGGRMAAIDAMFDDLGRFLPGFLAEVLRRQPSAPPPPVGPFPVDLQRQLGLEMMATLGFDFAHGRLDVSTHPFCGGIPDDVRITTRYDEGDFMTGLMGILHETGHALYEMGLPVAWRTQPVGRARGMSLHESQSLLMEMQVCRSPEFFVFAAPRIARFFDSAGELVWNAEALRAATVRVQPGFIRVDADEVTYPAHIILRYRLERALIAGELEVAGLPDAWNDGMVELLGIRPPNDRLGCLQDLHWYDGAFGYFPTYTLGAMTAAQLFEAARQAMPGVLGSVSRGDFSPLLGWLRTHVHGLGSSLTAGDLLVAATGRPLDSAAFKTHLQQRYLA